MAQDAKAQGRKQLPGWGHNVLCMQMAHKRSKDAWWPGYGLARRIWIAFADMLAPLAPEDREWQVAARFGLTKLA
ncbi:MAG: hypothetical protein QM682_09140 [Paracoccus sp. (in: a-proteobacteria)]|uniref:hypothetical protein n=1 Tax=Paracoccus sp. TaxID=267 RepID=UPI0039E2A83E